MPIDESARRLLTADAWAQFKQTQSDQQKRVPYPALEEPAPEGAPRIALPAPEDFASGGMSLIETLRQRESRRKFADTPLSLEQMAFICWAAQGVRQIAPSGAALLRTVPSGGARHPFELYLLVLRAAGIEPGLYRYLSLSHELCQLVAGDMREAAVAACGGQRMAGECGAVLSLTAVPYRAEWRYPLVWPKLILLDAGHVMQNVYLAAEACRLGCCAVAAYDQRALDSLLKVDGERQFAVYAAAVGQRP